MKYENKNYINQLLLIILSLALMGLYFLICFTVKEVDPKTLSHNKVNNDQFTTPGGYVFIFSTYLITTIVMFILCLIINKYKSVKYYYFFTVLFGIATPILLFVLLGTFVNSGDEVTMTQSKIMMSLIGCFFLNVVMVINMLCNTCKKCFYYRTVAHNRSGYEMITKHVKGWTEKKNIANVKNIYGDIIASYETNIYHPGYDKKVSVRYDIYKCFVCGNSTKY